MSARVPRWKTSGTSAFAEGSTAVLSIFTTSRRSVMVWCRPRSGWARVVAVLADLLNSVEPVVDLVLADVRGSLGQFLYQAKCAGGACKQVDDPNPARIAACGGRLDLELLGDDVEDDDGPLVPDVDTVQGGSCPAGRRAGTPECRNPSLPWSSSRARGRRRSPGSSRGAVSPRASAGRASR